MMAAVSVFEADVGALGSSKPTQQRLAGAGRHSLALVGEADVGATWRLHATQGRVCQAQAAQGADQLISVV